MSLRRYWIRFALSPGDAHSAGGLLLGCGVTAWNYDDALHQIREHIFKDEPLPEITAVVEDVDTRTLDDHVRPNMTPPIWRGIWYPPGYTPPGQPM